MRAAAPPHTEARIPTLMNKGSCITLSLSTAISLHLRRFTTTGLGAGAGGEAARGGGACIIIADVTNTHLSCHPFAPHIRPMHTAAMLEEAAATI